MSQRDVEHWARLVAVLPIDWWEWQRCQVCRATTGAACRSRSSRVVEGLPDGLAFLLALPHRTRRPRTRNGRPMPFLRVPSVDGATPPGGPTTR